MIDQLSIERIKTLHPIVRESATKILTQSENILKDKAVLRIAYALRSFEEQASLYAIGRTIKVKEARVTNAKAGQSWHNYGLAFDIVFLIPDKDGKMKASWDMKTDFNNNKIFDWSEIVTLCKKEGWEWGGDWKSLKDYPHFEKTYNLSLSTALSRYKNKDFIAGTNFINI